VEENADRVEPEPFGPTQFPIHRRRIERFQPCHVSFWLIAVDGMKLQPTGHGCASYHRFARSTDHRPFSFCGCTR
jgi:hypothetical protein